jgi:hypothetical protein
MLIYNVTIKIDHAIHTQWLTWLQQEHIPAVLATGCFSKATVLHLLDIDDSEGPTYAVQYVAENNTQYDVYIEKFAADMRQRSFDKWGNRFIAFRSLMEVVN